MVLCLVGGAVHERGDGARLAVRSDARAIASDAQQPGKLCREGADRRDGVAWRARLAEAVLEGQHRGLLVACPFLLMRPGSEFMGLLFACTRLGVEVGFLLPGAVEGLPADCPRPVQRGTGHLRCAPGPDLSDRGRHCPARPGSGAAPTTP
jgi:hypothetical protein